MSKVVTFIAAVTTMAVLGLLIFFLEKTKTEEEWTLMAAWFRLCDWLLPRPRSASSHQSESSTTLPPRVGDQSDVRNQELRLAPRLLLSNENNLR